MTIKTPQDRKSKARPARISAPDLAQRRKLLERAAALVQQAQQLEEALVNTHQEQLKAEGAWELWREQIEERYGMVRQDRIEDDGAIVRATVPASPGDTRTA